MPTSSTPSWRRGSTRTSVGGSGRMSNGQKAGHTHQAAAPGAIQQYCRRSVTPIRPGVQPMRRGLGRSRHLPPTTRPICSRTASFPSSSLLERARGPEWSVRSIVRCIGPVHPGDLAPMGAQQQSSNGLLNSKGAIQPKLSTKGAVPFVDGQMAQFGLAMAHKA